jgi:hypothetical protein
MGGEGVDSRRGRFHDRGGAGSATYDRIQRMFDALSRAGKHQQIIVLTCRLRSFGSLGGRTLRLSGTVAA